ncbi:LysR family transcriptional regulator [Prauserella rugosa]|uniref:DNA-binding transcriptional LysR family regulator n=1 Tax=Prauserella rugosa TaxID=43354 RepID=A0A660CHL5_9PSEU|nr:LysR family transcriptional regulator [Prauserella rugosa]KMS88785.1 LysR family transcriptional regulator [Streptomyces regensis]TWH20405.1 DNA-binding transcriptional LysR family regulator [Prauserella rugosa]
MDLHHVKAFLAVAEELHFGRAAARLHIAQPPLSRTIQQLERHLGSPLFDRTTRRVRLTPQGEALLPAAYDIVHAFDTAERVVAHAGDGAVGKVAIGFAGPSSHPLISALAQQVRQDQPGIELALSSTTFGSDAMNQLTDGTLDLAIVRWDSTPPGLRSRVVRVDHYVIVVPESHPLAGRTSVSMEELADEPWVFLEASSGSSLRDIAIRKAEEAGFAPKVAQHGPDTWTLMALVAAGVGLTFTVDTAFRNVITTGLSVIPLEDGTEEALARLVWRTETSPAVDRVLELSEIALPTPEGYAGL